MRAIATGNVTLRDGTMIPKHSFIAVSGHQMRSPDIYENPHTFDGHRFTRLYATRQAGGNDGNIKQEARRDKNGFAAVSSDHMGFGFGKRACPSRFFVTTELKAILCYLLLHFDWKLQDEAMEDKMIQVGFLCIASPSTKLLIRRRETKLSNVFV